MPETTSLKEGNPAPVDLHDGPRWLWPLANCLVVVFGFVFVWYCGHRGIYLNDQSMIFDGAWRLLQGQVPYRDVLFPFLPLTFVVQALFFKMFGVDFSTTVLSAAMLNAAAGLFVALTIDRVLPRRRVVAICAGLATDCWFLAPFGTLWLEQTAFFFSLVALFLILEAELSMGPRAYWLCALGGLLAALSVLSKQNAGLLFCPVLAGMTVISRWREPWAALRRLSAQLAGFVFGMGCFLLWLLLFSDARQFFHSSIAITRSLAAQRAPANPILFISGLLTFSEYPLAIRWCALFFAIIGLLATIVGVRTERSDLRARNLALAGWIIISCLPFQQLFIVGTDNEAENGVPFIGLVGGLALALLSGVLDRQGVRLSVSSGAKTFAAFLSGRTNRRLVFVASALVWLALILPGARVSWKRYVQQFGPASRFDGTLQVNGARRVRWADFSYAERPPTDCHVKVAASGPEWWLRKADFEGVNQWLAQHPGNFFVFGDSTILYGLHGRISPQPWLYFIRGHSYLPSDLPNVDERVTAALARNQISAVIVEKVSWTGCQDSEALNNLPKLKAWISGSFSKVQEFGLYDVWKRNAE